MFEYGERREIPEGFRDDVFLADLGESHLDHTISHDQ